MRRSTLASVVASAALALAGCGESDSDKALNEVCDARADIEQQVDELSNLTLTTATLDGIKESLSSIQDDVNKIVDAQGGLSDDRRDEIESANRRFADEVRSIAGSLGTSLSIGDAKSKLEDAFRQLADSYEENLAPIDCDQ
jgi:hypothetical protein